MASKCLTLAEDETPKKYTELTMSSQNYNQQGAATSENNSRVVYLR